MLETKIVSSLEKCFIDQTPADFEEITKIRIYKNTGGAFQFIMYNGEESKYSLYNNKFKISFKGEFSEHIRIRSVESVPNFLPVCATAKMAKEMDGGLLRTTPGLYPDVLVPLTYKRNVPALYQVLQSFFVEIREDHGVNTGTYPLVLTLSLPNGETVVEKTLEVQVINACLPEQDTKVTQWFYADCLADYYCQDVWSDRHFKICENFIRTAVENGINMILMPVFTPPLDTAIGSERTTTQLVGITVADGKYCFDFSLVDRWIDICKRCGVKYYEISHLFTQWGAAHAPKIMATVDGEYKKIFGWETDAAGEEYVTFLNLFLKEFTAYLEKAGLKDNVYFHISDEPISEHLEQYKLNKKNLNEVLKGWKILDALSHVEFYKKGICEIPVPVSNVIEDFAKEDISERWVYYCCGPWVNYSNRFMCMHSARTRCIGLQMYKYGIKGFLHWGYNYYNSQHSISPVNPFLNGNAGNWEGGGDAVSVYPGSNGEAWESLRIIAFKQGLEDIRALTLCEQLYGREAVVAELEKLMGTITFENVIDDTATMIKVRNKIDEMVMGKL